MTIRKKLFLVSAGALVALAPALGWAQPVRIEVGRPVTVVTPAPAQPVTVVTPAPAETRPITVVTPVPEARPITVVATAPADTLVAPETLQVDGIKAQQVRARAIYANRIDANQVRGVIYQTAGLQGLYGHGQLNVPDVAASVIYADTITANVVSADAVYVRDLRINR